MQDSWGPVAAPAGQWRRFQAACKNAFEQAQPFFEKRHEVQAENLVQLEAFLERGHAVAADETSDLEPLKQFMRKSRQYAVVIILIIAAIITPTPDVITMLTVSFPMFLLYELSIVVASRVHKKRMKADADFYNNEEQQTGDKQPD